MQAWIISFMNDYGYFAVFLLIAAENIFPPIPSEIILCFGGFMTTYTSLHPILVVIAATIGSVIGAIILYGIGRIISIEKLENFLSGKAGKILRIKPEQLHKSQLWFDRRGKFTVFICRFVPIIRSLISIPAGMAKMNIVSFTILTTIGTLMWNIVLVFLGAAAGESWTSIVGVIENYSHWILIIFIIVFILCLLFVIYKMIKKKD